MALGTLFRIGSLVRVFKEDVFTLYYAWKHPGTPAYVKGGIVLLLGYIISPVDVIPDTIPFFGIMDDIALIPLAVMYLTGRLPETVRQQCQQEGRKWGKRLPWFLALLLVCLTVWIVFIVLLAYRLLAN